jgi:predicted nucleic acid-binding protein
VIRYFDTSALMPYYRAERSSARCEAVLRESAEGVMLSDLAEVEFASTLARLVRMGELDEPGAALIQRMLSAHVAEGRYLPMRLESAHMRQARDWLLLRTTALRSLDTLHLALAAASGAELVTRDAVLAGAAHRFGVAVLHIPT